MTSISHSAGIDVICRVLDLLFKFFACWGFRVIPELFLRDMHRALSIPPDEVPPRLSHYSPMLHNAILALATAFSDNPNIRNNQMRDRLAQKAKEYLETECQKPNLSVINALNTLASYHSSRGEQSLGYLYFGMHYDDTMGRLETLTNCIRYER